MRSKRFMALLLTVMLVLGTCVTGVSVSAEEIEESYQLSTTQAFATQPETETTVATIAETTVATEETTFETEPSEDAEVSEVPQLIGNSELVVEPAETEAESDTVTVYFYNWFGYGWENVYAYYWSDDNTSMVDEPGVEMDYLYVEEYDYYTEYSRERSVQIPADAQYVKFHNGYGDETVVLEVPDHTMIFKAEGNGEHIENPDGTWTYITNGKWNELTKGINFSDRASMWGDWESESSGLYAYYWSDDNSSMVQWPGVELKKSSQSCSFMFSAEIPMEAEYIVFHNNKGAKTEELTIPTKYFEVEFSTTYNNWVSIGTSQEATGEYYLGVVAGDKELCGTDWEYNLSDSYENVMKCSWDYWEDRTYTKTYKNVQPAEDIHFKIADIEVSHGHMYDGESDHNVTWRGDENGNDIVFSVVKPCDVTITYIYDYSNPTITVSGDGVVMSTDTKEDLFKYRVLDDGTASLVAYTLTGKTSYNDPEYVTIPTEIDGYKVTQLDGTFAYVKWADVDCIPETITNIGNCTFMNSNAMYQDMALDFGEALTNIGEFAFYQYYYGYYSFVIRDNVKTIGRKAFGRDNEYSDEPNITIYGDSGSEAERYSNAYGCKFISLSDGEIFGDFKVALKNNSNGNLTGEVELEAGTYSFKVKVGENEYGGNYTFNDKASDITYSTDWKKSSTLNATGGKYVFEFDSKTKKLNIFCIREAKEVKLIGNVDYTLEKSAVNSNVFEYVASFGYNKTIEFKISVDGVEYGFGGYFYERMNNVQYSENWKSSTHFNNGYSNYNYKIIYDTSTNRLSINPIMNVSDVYLSGDLYVDLEETEYGSGIFTTTTYIAPGTYEFMIEAGYYTYCFGYTFTDYITNVQYNPEWNSYTKFNAKGGNYKVTFDTTTNRLTVCPVK